MNGVPSFRAGPTLQTERLLLRPQTVDDAVVQRQLWLERDARVPAHRRIGEDGRPTVADIEERIRAATVSDLGLLTVERKDTGDVIGYCGLIDTGRGGSGEPEIAFELLQRTWRRGYATEASRAVLAWARSSGFERLWATVWDWNLASLRVLGKLGFTMTDEAEAHPGHGTTMLLTRRL